MASRATKRRYLQLALKLDKEPRRAEHGRARRDRRQDEHALACLRSCCAGLALAPGRARARAAGADPRRRRSPPTELRAAIDKLGKLDYDTRTKASRTIRRSPAAQAVPALMQAVSDHADGYVRYRALVLLTGFNDPRARDVDA